MKNIFTTVLYAATIFSGSVTTVQADSFEVTVTNLTRGQIFSPLIAYTHNRNQQLFSSGDSASAELAALAQDADTSGLNALLSTSANVNEVVSGTGAIIPGSSETITIDNSPEHTFLTLASMLVTTNDAFMAINGIRIPSRVRSTFTAYAYDAGSEANNESCDYIPGPPCNNPNQSSDETGEGYVHIHAGIHGIGDLEAAQYDWRNPVAKITIKRINSGS